MKKLALIAVIGATAFTACGVNYGEPAASHNVSGTWSIVTTATSGSSVPSQSGRIEITQTNNPNVGDFIGKTVIPVGSSETKGATFTGNVAYGTLDSFGPDGKKAFICRGDFKNDAEYSGSCLFADTGAPALTVKMTKLP